MEHDVAGNQHAEHEDTEIAPILARDHSRKTNGTPHDRSPRNGSRSWTCKATAAHQPSFGWDTLKMAETYTRTADQERPAEAAMHLLEI